MRYRFGYDSSVASRHKDVIYDTDLLSNGHLLLCGMSGSGKTWMLNQMLNSFALTRPATDDFRIHVFDVHGDIHTDRSLEHSLIFSEQTDYGLNPFRIDPDPHTGGVRKKVQSVLNIINRVSRELGERQEGVFRNLAYETYRIHGFDVHDPATWVVNDEQILMNHTDRERFYLDVPIGEKDEAKALGARWDAAVKCWYIEESAYRNAITRWRPKMVVRRHPSLTDIIRVARHTAEKSFLGINSASMSKLMDLHRAAGALQKRKMDTYRQQNGGDIENLFPEEKAKLLKARDAAVAAFKEYAESNMSGHELDDLMRYDNYSTLSSVLNRLENMEAIGIFKTRRPPFDPSKPVWHYDLTPLDEEEATMFTMFKLEELMSECIKLGQCDHVRCVVVLDEAKRYAEAGKGGNQLDKLSNEMRKFGMVGIYSSQTPHHFTKDTIGSVGTKVLLRTEESYWPDIVRKMQLSNEDLNWVKPREGFLVQMKTEGNSAPWQRVLFGNTSSYL